MKGSSGGSRLCKGFQEWDLGEITFTGEPKRWGFLGICKVPCIPVSLSIGALFGEAGGGSFARTSERK